jgi:hypothetical protein
LDLARIDLGTSDYEIPLLAQHPCCFSPEYHVGASISLGRSTWMPQMRLDTQIGVPRKAIACSIYWLCVEPNWPSLPQCAP